MENSCSDLKQVLEASALAALAITRFDIDFSLFYDGEPVNRKKRHLRDSQQNTTKLLVRSQCVVATSCVVNSGTSTLPREDQEEDPS